MPIDTTPSTVATTALQSIPFETLIGGPLDAAIKAEAKAAAQKSAAKDEEKRQKEAEAAKKAAEKQQKEAEKARKEAEKLAKEAEIVWLASDDDREGEAISWHLCEVLNLDVHKTKRIV